MTTPFPFTAGQVLTAAQMNAITELVTNTQTGDYTLAATDAGDRVIANKASAITFTVPNSVFTAAQVVHIHNIGAGTLTIAAGAGATVNSAGGLTVNQYQGGTLFFTSASSSIWFPTEKVPGLVYITGGTVTLGSALSFDNCFSSTYANYRIFLTHTAGNNPGMRLRAGGSDISLTNYDNNTPNYTGGAAGGSTANSQSSWTVSNGTGYSAPEIFLGNPFASTNTAIAVNFNRTDSSIWQVMGGRYNATTSCDGFSIIGTSITVTARIYGINNG